MLEVNERGRTAEQELEILRCSIGRVAQRLNVQLDWLQVIDDDLFALTKQDKGWNALCAALIDRVDEIEWSAKCLYQGLIAPE